MEITEPRPDGHDDVRLSGQPARTRTSASHADRAEALADDRDQRARCPPSSRPPRDAPVDAASRVSAPVASHLDRAAAGDDERRMRLTEERGGFAHQLLVRSRCLAMVQTRLPEQLTQDNRRPRLERPAAEQSVTAPVLLDRGRQEHAQHRRATP